VRSYEGSAGQFVGDALPQCPQLLGEGWTGAVSLAAGLELGIF